MKKDLAFVKDEIRKKFPGARITFFGSRIRGDFRAASDLDVCIDNNVPLDLSSLSALRESLDGSDLTYKVDIVDWHRISPDFQEIIRTTGKPEV